MNVNYKMVEIHPLAKIGADVEINSFTTIGEDVEIGDGTWIGSNVTIYPGARIGKNCKIFPGAVISAIPQDLKFNGEYSLTIIGDNTVIRECVTINRGTIDRNKTVIGSNCLIMAYSHIAHDCIVGDSCIFSNNSTLAGHVTVGNHVVLAGLTAVQQFCNIGDHCFITGGSLVRKDIPPFVKTAREPLSYVGVNSVGLSRRGFSTEEINHIQQIYREIFVKGQNTSQAIDKILKEIPSSKYRNQIIDFIKKSKRGIMKGFV